MVMFHTTSTERSISFSPYYKYVLEILKIFFLIKTESNSRCSYDKIEVYEGDGTMIHKYCGKNLNNINVS